MPCHESLPFPSYPLDIEFDTLHFHQAMAEHNLARSEADLPIANFLELSAAERHDVLGRAQKIKMARRYNAIYLTRDRDRQRAAESAGALSIVPFPKAPSKSYLGVIGAFLLIVGMFELIQLLIRCL